MLRALINNGCPILTNPGAPVNGVAGTFAGQAGTGSTLIDYTNGVAYINVGTLASPIWAADSGPVTGLGGLGSLANAKMTYDFTVDGGAATSTIVPANSPTLPSGAIILGGTVDVTVACVGAGSISLGTTAGSGVASLKAATAAATYAINTQQPIIPVFTAATYLKLTAAGRLSLTTSVGTITAGRFDVNVVYVQGN
jgi:hypothetical protein